MDHNTHKLTLEKAKWFYSFLGNMVIDSAKELDWLYLIKKKISKNQKDISDILSLHMHVLYLLMDISVLYRMYVAAQIPHEERFAIKQLNVIMIEGFKRLFGFGKGSRDSLFHMVSPQNNQITATDIEGYNQIKEVVTKFGNDNNMDKRARDISVHYDVDVNEVYTMLININAEETTKNLIECLAVFKKFTGYIRKVEKPYLERFFCASSHPDNR